MIDSVKVLNGVAKVGDTVAVAVRDGNQAAIRVGVVTGFTERKQEWYRTGAEAVTRMKIRVTHTSSAYHAGREIGVEMFDRVVIVQSGAAAGE